MVQQWVKDDAAQNRFLRDELVRIARCGAAGDAERVRIQVMRLIRSLRESGDGLADELQNAVFTGPEVHFPPARVARKAAPKGISEPVPTDGESRLDLLRVEDPPVIPHAITQDALVMRRLDQLILETLSQSRLKKLGLEAPRTALFMGAPGVGKTMAARHIAVRLGLPLLILDLASVMSSLLGKSGSNLKQVFKFAQSRPCVFFLDEIDAVAKRRDDDSDVGELKRVVAVLLQEVDIWSSSNLMIAATNHPQLLDPALQRRFDTVINFPRPNFDDLLKLSSSLLTKSDLLPSGWARIVARLNANASHSSFVKDLTRLRRAFALGGKKSGVQTLQEMAQDYVSAMSKNDRKQIGLLLIDEAGVSQRDASAVVGIARETLRSAKKQEV